MSECQGCQSCWADDMPEHYPIPVDENGDGPVPYDEVPARIVCACGSHQMGGR